MTQPYSPATWRLIVSAASDGAANMAIDEAILTAVVAGTSPPTLRFYTWSPPCLSLGRSQPLAAVDQEACRAAGMDVVRRPTGGKAILHIDELTYSVALLQGDPRAIGDVVESYRRLSEGLLAGLSRLGIDAAQARGARRRGAGMACFDAPSEYEITAGGRKLLGSAQWRPRGGILQHGALPLTGDIARILSCLAMPEEERELQRHALRRRACTLEQVLRRQIPFAEAAQSLAEGFAEALNLTLVPGELATGERRAANRLRRTRYAIPDWRP